MRRRLPKETDGEREAELAGRPESRSSAVMAQDRDCRSLRPLGYIRDRGRQLVLGHSIRRCGRLPGIPVARGFRPGRRAGGVTRCATSPGSFWANPGIRPRRFWDSTFRNDLPALFSLGVILRTNLPIGPTGDLGNPSVSSGRAGLGRSRPSPCGRKRPAARRAAQAAFPGSRPVSAPATVPSPSLPKRVARSRR